MAGRGLGATAAPGARLYADVVRYEGFGDHRTGSRGDAMTARWIAARLRGLGFAVFLQPFPVDLFEPGSGRLQVGAAAAETFPLWPVRTTGADGVRGPLSMSGAAGPGRIAIVSLPHAANASLAAASYRGPIDRAVAARPAAVVGVTEGPTGALIALNVAAAAAPWPMPVALIGSRDGESLLRDAADGDPAFLLQQGRSRRARAHNVIARRSGRGDAMVLSTPISGWFRCAGERGAGIALFLAVAEHLARRSRRPLHLIATSGHEFEGMGSRVALPLLPPPSRVAAWVHIGANVAGAELEISVEAIASTGRPFGPRGVGATTPLIGAVRRAYEGLPPYAPPVVLDRRSSVGDLSHYLEAGYDSIMGLVGAHPLHHTRLDLARYATSPLLLDQALQPLIRAVDAIDRA